MKFALVSVLLAASLFLAHSSADAAPIVLDFEGLSDLDPLGSQFPGLLFANARVLTAGLSLNEIEFPPHSGSKVIFDDGGAITVTFASPIVSFGAFFTYSSQVTISVLDGATPLGSVSSAFSSNLALSGDPGSTSNEFLQFAAVGISSVVIQGNPQGGSFVLDDLTYDAGAPTTVPEPGTWSLVAFGLAALLRSSSRRKDSATALPPNVESARRGRTTLTSPGGPIR